MKYVFLSTRSMRKLPHGSSNKMSTIKAHGVAKIMYAKDFAYRSYLKKIRRQPLKQIHDDRIKKKSQIHPRTRPRAPADELHIE